MACADDEFLSDDAWSVDDDDVVRCEGGKEARQFFSESADWSRGGEDNDGQQSIEPGGGCIPSESLC